MGQICIDNSTVTSVARWLNDHTFSSSTIFFGKICKNETKAAKPTEQPTHLNDWLAVMSLGHRFTPKQWGQWGIWTSGFPAGGAAGLEQEIDMGRAASETPGSSLGWMELGSLEGVTHLWKGPCLHYDTTMSHWKEV